MPYNRRLDVPERIEVLRDTIIPGFDRWHRYLCVAPCKPGICPLLLLKDGLDGHEYTDVLAVLPAWGITTATFSDPLCATALSLVGSHYKSTITELRRASIIKYLPKELVDGREHGLNVPHWAREKLYEFKDAAKDQDVSPRLLEGLNDLLPSGASKVGGPVKWSPMHLSAGNLRANDSVNWRIVENWAGWEAKKLGLSDRYLEFNAAHPNRLSRDAFRTRLYYLNLEVPLDAGLLRRKPKGSRRQAMLKVDLKQS